MQCRLNTGSLLGPCFVLSKNTTCPYSDIPALHPVANMTSFRQEILLNYGLGNNAHLEGKAMLHDFGTYNLLVHYSGRKAYE